MLEIVAGIKLNFGGWGKKIAITEVLVDLNLAVLYGIAIHILCCCPFCRGIVLSVQFSLSLHVSLIVVP